MLETITNTVTDQTFLAEDDEKHCFSKIVFLIDGVHSLQTACDQAGY